MAAPINERTLNSENKNETSGVDKRYAFLFGAATVSVMLGFGVSLFSARRRDPLFFRKMLPEQQPEETGSWLATKALMVGSVLSVSTIGLMVLGVYKLFGVSSFTEFDAKLREYFPKKEPVGRVDFKDLKDLADYLISEDRKAEERKREQNSETDQS